TIEHEFLNYYDGYQDWAKLYDINIHFSFYWNPQPTYDQYSYAKLIIKDDVDNSLVTYNLDSVTGLNSLDETFEFDSSSASSIYMEFKVCNGIVDIVDDFDLNFEFKCLDGDSQVYNEQNFTIEFDTTFDINEQEFGNWKVETSFNLIALTGEYLQIYIDVKTTTNPNWETKYSSTYTAGASPSFDIRSAIGEGTYLTNLRIQYILKGYSPNLNIDTLRLMDNRSDGERPVLETEFYMNLEDVSLYTIESLNIEFSHKLLEPIDTFEFLVKDKDGLWQECDNSYVINSLYENSIDLPITSYINNNNDVYFKFHIEGIEHYDDHAFIFELNKFKLNYRWTRTGGDNNAEMSYSNFDLDGFLNRYDKFEGDNMYLMKYEVELTFQHQYKQKDISYTPIANFHINGDVEGISATNNIFTNGTFNKIFNFTSGGSSEGFDMEFEVSNGELIITNFEVNARFLCLNISGKEYLEQNFIMNTSYAVGFKFETALDDYLMANKMDLSEVTSETIDVESGKELGLEDFLEVEPEEKTKFSEHQIEKALSTVLAKNLIWNYVIMKERLDEGKFNKVLFYQRDIIRRFLIVLYAQFKEDVDKMDVSNPAVDKAIDFLLENNILPFEKPYLESLCNLATKEKIENKDLEIVLNENLNKVVRLINQIREHIAGE
ncbi:MAG: hypothetical protein P8Y97_03010, partial [Candidatus Lokiarchaeota archaeon]